MNPYETYDLLVKTILQIAKSLTGGQPQLTIEVLYYDGLYPSRYAATLDGIITEGETPHHALESILVALYQKAYQHPNLLSQTLQVAKQFSVVAALPY